MKLVIASDIHGSAIWCERLLATVDARQPDRLVLLGDLLYHGPRNDLPQGYDPKRVASLLGARAESIIAVRGNCDAEVDQMMLGFPCLADYAVVFDGERELFCTHGHVWSTGHLPPLRPGSVFCSGHTHVKRDEVVDGIRLVNPGSVGLPKDGSHSCAVYENGVVEFVDLGASGR